MRKSPLTAPGSPRRRFRIRTSLGGFWFVVGTGIIGLTAVDSDINLLLLLFGLCVGAIMLSAFWDWRGLRRITVQRIVPDVLGADQPAEIRYLLTNHRRWGSIRNLQVVEILPRGGPIGETLAFVSILRPGESVTVDAPIRPARRGRIQFGQLTFKTSFPFAIFIKSFAIHLPDEAIVLPRLLMMNGDPNLSFHAGHERGGPSGLSRSIGDEEFYGVREFREGDNPRRIHWRRSARTGQLMVREMARTMQPQVWCVVDTQTREKDEAQQRLLEEIVSAAATFVCSALEQGMKVGLICNGEPLVVLPPGAGRANRPRLLREMALREHNHSDPLAEHIRRLSWPMRWRGPCMLLAVENSVEVRRAAGALNRSIGHTTILVPGTPGFDEQFTASGGGAKPATRTESRNESRVAATRGGRR
jgi:uncharacterized protein (DUF58 family)